MSEKKKKMLLIVFEDDEIAIYEKLKQRAKADKRTLPNTAKLLLKDKLK